MTAPLHCAGCGIEGRAPTIDAPPGDQRRVLRPTFGWGDPPRTALLCDLCRSERPPAARREGRR